MLSMTKSMGLAVLALFISPIVVAAATTSTIATTQAGLAGQGTQLAAYGVVRSTVITITKSKGVTVDTSFTVDVKGLTLADGSTVTFKLNGTQIGVGTVKKGRTSLHIQGSTAPKANPGDTFTVIDPNGTATDLSGTFGATTTVTKKGGGHGDDGGNDNSQGNED